MLNWFKRRLTSSGQAKLGVDLGSWSCRLVSRKGLESSCASRVLWDLSQNRPLAVGDEAEALTGRHPQHWLMISPIRQGLLSDFDAGEHLLRHLLRGVSPGGALLAAAPALASPVELATWADLLKEIGAGQVCLLPSACLTALAAGRSPLEEAAVAVVDLGHEVIQASVFSRGSLVHHLSTASGSGKLREQIREHVLRRHWLAVGQDQVGKVLARLSAPEPGKQREEEQWLEVRGKDLTTGLPRSQMVGLWELKPWLEQAIHSVQQLLSQLLEEIPPSLLQPLVQQGLVFSGGLSHLGGLVESIQAQLSLPVHRLEQPEQGVALGLRQVLDEPSLLPALLRSPLLSSDWQR